MSQSERPSRQDLVVQPRSSSLPVLIGAAACGLVGFGLVWALGIGRSRPVGPDGAAQDAPAFAATPEVEMSPAEPAAFPLGDDPIDALPPPDRWQSRGAAPVADRYATAASLESPAPVTMVAAEERPGARYATADVPAADPSETADEPAGAPAATAPGITDSDVPPLATPPSAAAPPASPPANDSVDDKADVLADEASASQPEDAGDLPVAAAPPAAPLPPFAPPVPAATPTPPFAAAPAAPAPLPLAEPPVAPPPAEPDHPPARPAFAAPAAPSPGVQGATAAMPYAAAPPLVPGAAGFPGSAPPPQSPPADASGQGRPGPMQLEGIQSPQLAVEKRGPREVQVGKPARYEILVRNVGSATAHDVTLRDAIPFGTALVATVPPASPVAPASGAGAEGELVWALGTLDPGGQARVTMEVMPQEEGEIGSVASVSFRADASIRSRATKPALKIEATEPKPVLIGRDMQLTLSVSNPGSGVATGVVLEGFLPETVSHRAGSELEFDVGQLRPGESRTIDLVLGTRGPGAQAARFTARADGGVETEQPVRLEVTAPTLELAVDMPLRRFLQRPATCRIAMTNAGTAPARAVELAAQLPPGMKFVRANNAGWHDERTHRVLWNLEELPPGETGTVEVVVMPVALGPQKIMSAARSADGLADQVAHVCEVEGLAAISFEVVDSEDPIEIGGVTEYVIRVANQGTKPATGVRVTASLLGDVEPVEAQGPGGHRIENRAVTFEPLVKLAPSEEAAFRIRARGRRPGDQRVQVQVISEDHPAPITKEEITRVYDDR
jgi:uncharacterized repeat protein (TIGR01451 family)